MKKLKYLIFLLVITACSQKEMAIDILIKNAIVFDGINSLDESQNILIKRNKIIAVLPNSNFNPAEYKINTTINANGQFVMPGFIEGHGHLLNYGESLSQLNLSTSRDWEEIINKVKTKAQTLPKGTWIEGRGWHQEKWIRRPPNEIEGYPQHQSLSSAVPNHPVFLTHASGHAAFANARAMTELGITKESYAPEGGRILRNERDELTGIFEENATTIFSTHIDETKDLVAIWTTALDLAAAECLKQGITSFQDAGLSIDQILWLRKKGDDNNLPLRLYIMAYDNIRDLSNQIRDIKCKNEADSFLTCRAVKAYYDGALGSRGAWLLDEYADMPNYYGQNLMQTEELENYADLCKRNHMQFCVHAIGDRANRLTLDLYEKYTMENKDARWRIEHAQHIDPIDQKRFADLSVIASMQPVHCTSDASFVVARLGEQRARQGAYVWRNLLDLNAPLAIGTDVPVESLNPFENIYAAVTRKKENKSSAFYDEQVMTRKEILFAYTAGNAFAAFEEKIKGRIKTNYLADLVILDTNLMNCSINQIPATRVITTILNGRIVYSAP